MYSGDEFYDDEVTSGVLDAPVSESPVTTADDVDAPDPMDEAKRDRWMEDEDRHLFSSHLPGETCPTCGITESKHPDGWLAHLDWHGHDIEVEVS
jgi:hypothetical protein